MDAPDVIGYLEVRHRRQFEELNIEQVETSRRLGQKTLERYWDRNSQESPQELPPWAKADEILQRVIQYSDAARYKDANLDTNCHTPDSIFTEGCADMNMSDHETPTLSSQRTGPGRGLRSPLQTRGRGKFRQKTQSAHPTGQRKPPTFQRREKCLGRTTRVQKSASQPTVRIRSSIAT